jgi:hypothetical protein
MKPGTEAHRSLIAGNPFVEMDANEVSADRVWLRRSPIGYLCIGLGSSAKLARFAFENVAPKRPFYSACRRIERDVAREGLAKARRLGLSIPFDAFEDNALRRIAIASALLKAGFDPEEQRDKDGEWTTGGAGAAAARVSPVFLPKPPPTPLLERVPPGVISALRVIAARAVGAIAVFRILFIPSNQSLVTEGTVPDRPDVRFKYDDDERVLTIHRDGADGSTYGFSAKPGPDGVFRDDQGRAFARRLDDGTVVIDPDTLPSADSGPSTRNNQPKLCPDPSADRARGLHGEDGEIDPEKIDNAARYQRYISEVVNGKANALPIGLGVALTDPATGKSVVFDECRRSDGTMIDAKQGYLSLMANPYQKPWRDTLEKMTGDAERQVRAAGDREIEWHFSEKKVADFMTTYFGGKNIPIKIIYTPAPPGLLKTVSRTDIWMGSWQLGATQQMLDYT